MKKLKWKSFKISALAELRNGGTPPKNEAKFWGGSIPFITAADLTEAVLKDGRSYVTRAGLESGKTVICEPGDLLIGTRTRVGQCSVAGKLMAASQDITRARINGGASAEYLLLFFRHLAGYLSFHSQGTSIQGITREVLEGVDVPVPSAEEQKRLVKKVSSVVARANQLAEHTQALASDIQRAVASFYDRLAAEAPQEPLHQVASPVRRPITTTPDGSYPELGLRSFGKGTFHKPALSGTEVGNKRIFRIHAGDLVFSNVFGWEGAIAVAQPEDDGRAGSHRYITYLADPARATPEFLCFHFLTARGLEDIRAASPGSAGRNRTLGLERLKQIPVPVPPIAEQRRFSELVKRQREITKLANSITEDLRRFEAALLAKAFRGEL